MQGRGLATILLAHLAVRRPRARDPHVRGGRCCRRTTRCSASSATAGCRCGCARSRACSRVEMPTELTAEARAALRASATRSRPSPRWTRSCGRARSRVVGASPDRAARSAAPSSRNLLAGGFAGALHAVNRRGRPVAGHPLPPLDRRRAGRPGGGGAGNPGRGQSSTSRGRARRAACAALVVIAAGFAEVGAEGARAAARAAGDLPRRRACGSSARTASACSTPTRRSG